MDVFDYRILRVLEEDADLPLTEIAKRVGLFSASAISKRIKRLKEEGYIKGFRAVIDYERLGFSFKTVTFVRARYGKDYNNRIGNWLRDMPGVSSVYFILGDIDFIFTTVSRNREDFLQRIERLSENEDIERTDSRVVLQEFKSTHSLDIF